jgi:hypothetical protein
MANNKKSNNKRYRKQKQRKQFTWLFVVLGGGLLLLAAVLFANRNGGAGGGTPTLSVDQKTIDYGYVKFGENRQFTLKVTNTGNGALRFKEKPFVEVLEGC